MTWREAIFWCAYCTDEGITRSSVTGAWGRCRHPEVEYDGHPKEEYP